MALQPSASSSSSEETAELPLNSRSTPHLPLNPSGLFPPFYNRPPTPLPPSPSLTSLLRPSFSSRPTTPDSSDVDSATTSTAAAVAKSARTAKTVPRASPKVPTYEYYGFALYLASSVVFAMYLLWAYLPSPFLTQLGIDYYPDRWWALAVPAWLVISVLYIYVALASYNTGYLTLPMGSIENLVDQAAMMAVVDRDGNIVRQTTQKGRQAVATGSGSARGKSKSRPHSRNSSVGSRKGGVVFEGNEVDWRSLWNEGTDAVMDIPIGGVNEILYGAGREEEE